MENSKSPATKADIDKLLDAFASAEAANQARFEQLDRRIEGVEDRLGTVQLFAQQTHKRVLRVDDHLDKTLSIACGIDKQLKGHSIECDRRFLRLEQSAGIAN